MDSKDIYRSANLLIEQYGGEAKSHAMQRAVDLRAAGDAEGERVWCCVFEAILELQAVQKTPGQALH